MAQSQHDILRKLIKNEVLPKLQAHPLIRLGCCRFLLGGVIEGGLHPLALGKAVNGLPHLGCTLGLALGGGGALSLCVCLPHGLCYSWVCLQLSQDHSRYVQYICLAASHCVSANPPTVQPTLHLNMRPGLSLKTRTAAFWSGRARHLFEGVKEGKLAHAPLVETTHESVKLFRGRYIR